MADIYIYTVKLKDREKSWKSLECEFRKALGHKLADEFSRVQYIQDENLILVRCSKDAAQALSAQADSFGILPLTLHEARNEKVQKAYQKSAFKLQYL